MTITHEYPDFIITMHSYLCQVDTREFDLKEHHDFKWLSKEKLTSLNWVPADFPIVEKLVKE